jgi:hypothetical protein
MSALAPAARDAQANAQASLILRPTPASSGTRPDQFGGSLHHCFAFRRGQAVELAGVAVRDQDMHAGINRPVDDRLEAQRRDLVLLIEGRDENSRNAG